MIVLTLTNCPPSLRGELTRWLLEINAGVYVGNVSTRVRDKIWERVQKYAETGRATMVFSSGHREQRLDFRTHQSDWEPIDFDGLKLILRPNSKKPDTTDEKASQGYSNAAKTRKARQMAKRNKKSKQDILNQYVVIDLETTGITAERDEIVEFGAVKVSNQEVEATFQSLVRIKKQLPEPITRLTGLTDQMLQQEGKELKEVLPQFLSFIGDLPVITHNGTFEFAFLNKACEQLGAKRITNRCEDTLDYARRFVPEVTDYKLKTLIEHFEISVSRLHRSVDDCFATMQLYCKLNEIRRDKD